MVIELGVFEGATLAKLSHRVKAYGIMSFLALVMSPFGIHYGIMLVASPGLEKMGEYVFSGIKLINVIPKLNQAFMPLAETGEFMYPKIKFTLSLWYAIFYLLIFGLRKKNYLKKVISAMVAISLLMLSLYPQSEIILNEDNMSSMTCMQEHYFDDVDKLCKSEKADHKILSNKMDMNILLNLNMKVDMKVSKSLKEYKMTLYYKYLVSKVTNQDDKEHNIRENILDSYYYK